MDRYIIAVGAVFMAAIVVLMARNAVSNPAEERRAWLHEQIARVPAVEPREVEESWPFAQWEQALDAKPALWRELVAPPPPPAPPAPPPPSPPKLEKMLEGVRVSKRRIGDKILLATPAHPKGTYVAVGEGVPGIQGVTLKEFDEDDATFTYTWRDRTLVYKIPRELYIN